MSQFRQKHSIIRQIQPAFTGLSGRTRNIETQLEKEPICYLVAGAHISANSSVGDTSVHVSTVPKWCDLKLIGLYSNIPFYAIFDAGTSECEIREIWAIFNDEIHFNEPLAYTHAEGDAVLYSEEAMVDVKWFGAKGDNSTDDTTAFSQASVQLGVIGKGYLFIPAGIYLVSTTINMVANTQVRGTGMQGTQIKYSGANRFILAQNISNILIRDLRITISVTGTRDCIELNTVTNGRVENVFLDGFQSDLNMKEIGINILGCNYITVSDCMFYRLLKGVYSHESNYLKVTHCYFREFGFYTTVGGFDSQKGIHILESDSVIMLGNVFTYIAYDDDGTYIYGCSIYCDTCDYVICVGNNSTVVGDYHYYAIHCTAITFSGNTGNQSGAAVTGLGYGFYFHGISGGVVTGNVTNTNYVAGIFWDECLYLKIGGNACGEVVKETPVDGLGYSGSATTRVVRSSLYTEWIPAKDFSVPIGYSDPALALIGPASDYAPVWRWAGGDMSSGLVLTWWRVPSNLIGTTFKLRLRYYWCCEGAYFGNFYTALTEVKVGVVTGMVAAAANVILAAPTALAAWQLQITERYSITVDGVSALRIDVGFGISSGLGDPVDLIGVEVLVE